jgi:ribosomal protein S25
VPVLAKALKMTQPTARLALKNLEKLGIVVETSGKQRNLLFVYEKYMKILGKDTQPFKK